MLHPIAACRVSTRPGHRRALPRLGQLGATTKNRDICGTIGSPADFACFESGGATFGWFQDTSMSSPQVAGVATLALAARCASTLISSPPS
jgi:hypothetical protein